ncbi:zinc ribbon domain-containing protein [Rhodobacteraceae bacterium N5(2021)]|uniref:Zinc ribbon domain-containing protein n=1 Tax=Gymnodinialimonas phycosphaerae TaxID=2841589 RepID=A0A975YI15_9RHOB|nr:zinc ribbon domain-containing protein [Gymnodinialimonas phycosphaerae]
MVPQSLWDSVQVKRKSRAHQQTKGRRGRGPSRPTRPFSGLLRCGLCGGGIAISKRRGGSVWGRCSTRTESGSCTNLAEMRIDRIEATIFKGLTEELRDPVYVRKYLKAYHKERARLNREAKQNGAGLERKAAKARMAFDRARALYIKGVTDGPEAEAEIHRLQEDVKAAQAILPRIDTEPEVIELHPASIERYLEALADLSDGRLAPDNCDAVAILRELVSAVINTPKERGLDVTVDGFRAALLGESPICRGLMVAEEGLEPPTRGL